MKRLLFIFGVLGIFLIPHGVYAVTCGFGTDIGNGNCRGYLTSTTTTSFSVPSDWGNASNTIEVIGAGGMGGDGDGASAGGGGAYSKVSNQTLSGIVMYQVGWGGNDRESADSNGGDTWFCNSPSNCATIGGSAVIVGAKGGGAGETGSRAGGSASSGFGTTKYSGGDGGSGTYFNQAGGGGGGAAGPLGNGANGAIGQASTVGQGGGGGGNGGGSAGVAGGSGGTGGNNAGGTGGGAGGAAFGPPNSVAGTDGGGGGGGGFAQSGGAAGGVGIEWDSTHGSGGGGGGGSAQFGDGGVGANYGGGGGGNGVAATQISRKGGDGIIVITYEPAGRRSLSKPPNNLGLIAYWPFNEGVSTLTGDFSGNGKTGTLQNSPTWVNGKFGKALSFDGGSPYVYFVGDIADFSISSGGSMTASAWIKTSDDNGAIVSFRNGLNGSPILDMSIGFNGLTTNSGHFIPIMRYDAGGGLVEITSTKRVDDGLWHHVVVIVDQSSNLLTAYVDGVEYSTAQNTDGVLTFGNDHISIGAERFWITDNYGTGDERFLDGTIDDVRVYSRAISAAEVSSLYKQGSTIVGGNEKIKVTNGLIGYWPFNGADVNWTSASAGVAYDRSGGGNNGTLVGMTQSVTPVKGKIGQALNFDGVNDHVTSINNLPALTAMTVSLWVNPNTTMPAFARVIETSYLDGFAISTDGSSNIWQPTIKQTAGDGAFFYGNNPVVGQWTLLTLTWDGTTARWYENGTQVSTAAVGSIPTSSNQPVHIGTDLTDSGSFNGKIDDVRVYNRALSAAEVKQIYYLGTGTIVGQ